MGWAGEVYLGTYEGRCTYRDLYGGGAGEVYL